ncbi:2-ketogluconate reductase [Cupriavidus yeoncheonensis]|uniref:2-ketogluconate reductase n=1 Tax=Cupriavidus yeoncheonensis TaxID=1462994 RepID=A0A916IWN2_9BURK|nr:2-hydroxyacid dehydrogenase [Cupriavidus yeoncheonensis]CAG2152962.1 2-ketogluconate reductase [Cupriavidus yeoncheonensis]
MKPAILLTQPVVPSLEAGLQAAYEIHRLYGTTSPDALLDEIGPRVEAVVTGGSLGLKEAVMRRLPALKIVAVSGVGTDAVDVSYARERGIHVTTTPDVLTADVADQALGLLISVYRRLTEAERYVRAGQWGKSSLALARRFSGKHIGIVGLGRVGRAIAVRAAAFGCPLSYTDLRAQPDVPYTFLPDIVALATHCDALVLAASADGAKPVVDAAVLDALGPDGVLINVARGRLIDEPELVRALQTGRIAGAGLDVFADEPAVPSALLGMDNVVIQPHRASATWETRDAMGEIVLANLRACLAGERPPTTVLA